MLYCCSETVIRSAALVLLSAMRLRAGRSWSLEPPPVVLFHSALHALPAHGRTTPGTKRHGQPATGAATSQSGARLRDFLHCQCHFVDAASSRLLPSISRLQRLIARLRVEATNWRPGLVACVLYQVAESVAPSRLSRSCIGHRGSVTARPRCLQHTCAALRVFGTLQA